MQNWGSIQVLGKLVITSEYFLQVTFDKAGTALTFSSGIGPMPTVLAQEEKPIRFEDCFLASDWPKFENQRNRAWKNNRQSFMVDLHKIAHPKDSTVLCRWEFFFVSEDFGTCLGLGHPEDPFSSFDLGLDEFIDNTTNSNELLDIVLESKLLGFWEFDLKKTTGHISDELAHVLGYGVEDFNNINNISWKKHIHPEDLPAVSEKLALYLSATGNAPFREEFRITTKDKLVIWVIGFGKTTKWDDEGRPLKMQGLFIDITEKKKQEILMQEHHLFLRDLAFQQSHSLRARVANILGVLQILETANQTPESKELLDILKNESKLLDQSLKKSIKESVLQNKSLEREIKPK
ncbi:hypothetical protein GCM10009119_24830 [Algoriphagus jejuensis]|uniref:histidine kinase n=1 Tax=Algoriphagus jejuensis TaxID=419934 RepID=A0ABN1N1V3_9BACT